MLLGRLHASTDPRDMNLPGVDLHELKGMRKRITTEACDENAQPAPSR